MGQNMKKKKQEREQSKREPPNQEVLDLIGSPNVWTPESENAWHEELKGMPTGEIYRRFPPIRKPGNVGLRGKNSGWGNND